MITIVCSSQNPLDEFKQHVIKSSGLDPKKIQFLGYENKGQFSLTEIYNKGLNEAVNDVVVFLHNDITIETNQWGRKLLKIFDRNKDYSIIGVAGTKELPPSGKWWENKQKMYGRVKHTHEGKTWLSAYSDDLGNEIEETVIVDGVFFAVNKQKIKAKFDESVKGFHFYEITFCFQNYLEGVKIGVTTLLKINHQSIGMTNESWETNRVDFTKKYKNNLPVSIKKKQRKNERLKILISSLTFNDETPKSKSILELATKLRKLNHEVMIWSNMDGKIPNIAKSKGIGLTPIQQPPGFVVGDGKWKMKTIDGEIVSKPNTLYRVKEHNFNIIQVFDDELIEHADKFFPNSSIVNTAFANALIPVNTSNTKTKGTITIDSTIDVDKIIKEYFEYI